VNMIELDEIKAEDILCISVTVEWVLIVWERPYNTVSYVAFCE
jgi:hypothetical protein